MGTVRARKFLWDRPRPRYECPFGRSFIFFGRNRLLTTILKGCIVSAPALGRLETTEHGYLIAENEHITGIYPVLPEQYAGAPVEDYGDDLIVQSTAYCMEKVEDDFMAKAATELRYVERFIREVPYWTAREHGKKYRLMYQVYTHPKYIRYGKQFFEGVNRRYTEYAKSLEPKLGIPYTTITPLIFILIQTCVHYAMFEDEYYLQSQLEALKQAIRLLMTQYRTEDARPDVKAES